MKMYLGIFAAFVLITINGCNKRFDNEKIKSKILSLHKANIEAHLKKDISFFTKNISGNYFSVKNGEITYPTKEEIKISFTDYLNNTTFKEYKEIEEPLIGYSSDGSIIWVVGKIKVLGTRRIDDGTEKILDFTCAWITLYKRDNNKLIRMGDVSTFK